MSWTFLPSRWLRPSHRPRRARMRAGAAALALAGAASLAAACSAGHTATVAISDRSTEGIRIATTAPASSLDFSTVGGAAIPTALMGNVYETLVTIDEHTGDIIPYLANSWQLSEDGTTYTFQLRDDVRFSNGDPFTAETAAFSINYVQQHWTNGRKAQMDPVRSATATGPWELTVELHHPSQRWLWAMSTAIGAMMTPAGIPTLATDPIGTGPFVIGQFSPHKLIHFEVNPQYWGHQPQRDITIYYFPDMVSSVNALEAGSIDVVWGLQAAEILDQLPASIHTEVGTTHGEVLLSMNNNAAPFNDPRVRQAVAYGVDRHAANAVLFNGLAADTGGAPVPPGDPWHATEDFYPFNPQRARELMAEAGAEGTAITLTVPTLPYAQTLSELLYAQLRDIGFEVTLETVEFPAVWLGQVMGAKDYQMSLVAHVEPRDLPQLFGQPEYYLGYDNPRVRDLLAQADQSDAETELMRSAVAEIMADAGALTLMNLPNIVLHHDYVSGVHASVIREGLPLASLEAER